MYEERSLASKSNHIVVLGNVGCETAQKLRLYLGNTYDFLADTTFHMMTDLWIGRNKGHLLILYYKSPKVEINSFLDLKVSTLTKQTSKSIDYNSK